MGLFFLLAIATVGCKQLVTDSDGPEPNSVDPVALIASPESSAVNVENGIVGGEARVRLFLRDRLGAKYVSDTERVVIRVSGVNAPGGQELAVAYIGENEYRASQPLTAEGTDTVVAFLNGAQVVGTPVVRLTTQLNAAEPVYDATNPDHVLHVYEDWSNHQTIADLGTALRGDGGRAWDNGGIKTYGAVVNESDGFGSVRHVTTDYSRDPPVPPDGHSSQYHWYIQPGDDNALGGPKNNRGFVLNPQGYLNKPAKAAVIYEWAVRYRGTNWYEGKSADINAGLADGVGRFNFEPYDSRLGVAIAPPTPGCSDIVCDTQYDDEGRTPLYSGLPPTFNYTAPNISRTQRDLGNIFGGPITIWYKQNAGWGTGPGEFSWGSGGVMVAAFNADLRGTNTPMWEAGWLYFKLQITKQAPGEGFGNGRIEMWVGKSPGGLLKVMEYIGDVGAREEGEVFVDPTGTSDQLQGPVKYFELAARRYQGGGLVDVGTIRIWSRSRP